jgi:hypothetical protein
VIIHERLIGFDTESKPTFTKGKISTGPHVVQFAVRDGALIAQVCNTTACEFIREILESENCLEIQSAGAWHHLKPHLPVSTVGRPRKMRAPQASGGKLSEQSERQMDCGSWATWL